ncbi:acyl-coenzyme A synthetase ACSM4, mitochondrial-like isoform X2 [Crotalus tigris]|nr:acyl-coenzyme A synthetase ACSM4, mitochondrial-like isoform X2 [Crotalus tigris]XP_039216382.1 acyl-coenzyme A synthetase ACSM4, mitochondrial-like isoform X2 [Crotalus tigris]XP_039216383.1 acyl-coenzyme A synthetase ACSM4, mitochondrial-like isoform X2 [Crotalus tigris]XP_039216384.1 acyl-coenzyme A synthetase ACSM4, mitochondrial-like isoform X2 [Crotalus tigris]XP_039216385.1 acyl-coenzyme A synthetase ACSM4, mitochondrial-like isoform X2 [Crotalus tigris]
MKMLFIKGQWLKSIWSRRKLGGLVPQAMKIFTSLDFSEFEAINRGDKEVPKYFNFANDVLDKWSKIEKNGERAFYPALWWIDGKGGEVKWDFEKLGLVSRKAANVLTGPCGLQRGDRVILILPRIPEWWMLTVACMRAGIVSLPGTPQLTAKDIQYRLQVSKAKGIITNDSLAPLVETISSACPSLQIKLLISERRREGWQHFKELFAAAPSSHNCVQTRSDEPMIIFFTSGTTGSPKMVEHSQTSLPLGLALPGRFWLDFKPSDVMWNMSDTGWVKVSVGSVFGPWLRGTSVFIHSMPQFDPKEVLNTLSKYPVTTMCTAPTAYRMLVQEDLSSYTFKNLSHCLAVAEPMNPEVVSQWKKQTGLQIHEGYGQTEVGMVTANKKGRPVKPGSMGTAFSSYDVQIVDEEGKILPPGQEGDIAIRIKPKRPFSFFSRYVDSPEKNSAVVRGNFYITGDRGWMDEDGYFWFIGRSDDVIISSGYRIGPFEVESALIEHPAVVESAVVSSPDIVRGEVVKAFVVLSPEFASHNPEKLACELQDHVMKVTAPYKYPRKVEFVQALPKTTSGKIRRNELRKWEWGQM